MLHCFAGMTLFPVPIAAGAVLILVLRTLKISHESVVRVAVTTRSVDVDVDVDERPLVPANEAAGIGRDALHDVGIGGHFVHACMLNLYLHI
jgi:hypothetical protein